MLQNIYHRLIQLCICLTCLAWLQVASGSDAKLPISGHINDRAGTAVAFNGVTAVVGAPATSVNANAAQGVVYVYTFTNYSWNLQTTLIASDGTAGDEFGTSVALSGDTLIVGSPKHAGYGAVYVYCMYGGAWVQQTKLSPTDCMYTGYGSAVALSDGIIVVGAPYDDLDPTGNLSYNNFGSAYIYIRSDITIWSFDTKLLASDHMPWDRFGSAVAIDGQAIVCGAPGVDYPNRWEQGAVYVFIKENDLWSEQAKLTSPLDEGWSWFGSSVAITGDRLLVGAPHREDWDNRCSMAFVFERSGSLWGYQALLQGSDCRVGDNFGSAVALGIDSAVVGSPNADFVLDNTDNNEGAAYQFTKVGTDWKQLKKFISPTGGIDALFGSAVAHAGGSVLIGAPHDSTASGEAYFFGEPSPAGIARNLSVATLCAESDNVGIPFWANTSSFSIEATHPTYQAVATTCAEDFTNCPESSSAEYIFTPYRATFDFEQILITVVREPKWWRPLGMSVTINGENPQNDIHFLNIQKKVLNSNSWPEVLVVYMDGNVRLKPLPPVGITDTCFGSSVIIGPVAFDQRALAEISIINLDTVTQELNITYRNGGTATISLLEIDSTKARIQVKIGYATDSLPIAMFRSMFVTDGNADTDHVEWRDAANTLHDDDIMPFSGGEGSEWYFYRATPSQHNTLAPDIRISIFPALSVTFNGTGGGTVNSNPSGFTCTEGTCCKTFFESDLVSLYATPDKDSLFTAWDGACGGSGTCTLTLQVNQYVFATFSFVKPVKIGGIFYDNLNDAYAAANTVVTTILARTYDFPESLNLNLAKAIYLKGGNDTTYGSQNGYSTILGNLTISQGSLVVDQVIIR